MKTIFLAFSFRPEDRELVGNIEQLLASHDIQVATGERLGGEDLTPAIKARIEQVDGLIAVLTKRDQKTTGGWISHPWVRDELNYARDKSKRTIAVVEVGVDLGGTYQEREHIAYDSRQPLPVFLALSETLGLWKRQTGRTQKIKILPDSLAKKLWNGAKVSYCFVRNGRLTPWQEGTPVQEPGGTFVYVGGVAEDVLIQFEIIYAGAKWQSIATPQFTPVELRKNAGRR